LLSLFKSYVINTSIAIAISILLVLFTGRPFTPDDYIAILLIGWMMGWFFKKVFAAAFLATESLKDEVKNLNSEKRD